MLGRTVRAIDEACYKGHGKDACLSMMQGKCLEGQIRHTGETSQCGWGETWNKSCGTHARWRQVVRVRGMIITRDGTTKEDENNFMYSFYTRCLNSLVVPA